MNKQITPPRNSSNLPLVSVIVPVYKVEAYIHQCVDSLLSQTYRNTEIILVDDGSPDTCPQICDEYARQDSRVRAIHQQNGGVNHARQTGIDAANGDYAIYVDSDDWVEPDMVAVLVARALEDDADVVMFDTWSEHRGHRRLISYNLEPNPTSEAVLHKIMLEHASCSVYDKMVGRDCYRQTRFQPPTLYVMEDLLYNVRLFVGQHRISYVDRPFYHYRQDTPNSLSKGVNRKVAASCATVIEELGKLLPAEQYDDFFHLKSCRLFYAMVLRGELTSELKLYPEIHQRIIKAGRKYRWYMPRTCCLSIALRGYPRMARFLYLANIHSIDLAKRVKSLLRR